MIFVLYERFQPVVRHSPARHIFDKSGVHFSKNNAGRALLGETVAFLGCFWSPSVDPLRPGKNIIS